MRPVMDLLITELAKVLEHDYRKKIVNPLLTRFIHNVMDERAVALKEEMQREVSQGVKVEKKEKAVSGVSKVDGEGDEGIGALRIKKVSKMPSFKKKSSKADLKGKEKEDKRGESRWESGTQDKVERGGRSPGRRGGNGEVSARRNDRMDIDEEGYATRETTPTHRSKGKDSGLSGNLKVGTIEAVNGDIHSTKAKKRVRDESPDIFDTSEPEDHHHARNAAVEEPTDRKAKSQSIEDRPSKKSKRTVVYSSSSEGEAEYPAPSTSPLHTPAPTTAPEDADADTEQIEALLRADEKQKKPKKKKGPSRLALENFLINVEDSEGFDSVSEVVAAVAPKRKKGKERKKKERFIGDFNGEEEEKVGEVSTARGSEVEDGAGVVDVRPKKKARKEKGGVGKEVNGEGEGAGGKGGKKVKRVVTKAAVVSPMSSLLKEHPPL
ncbi:hypothetical protein HDV00_003248, partial [Rhizophlyctis rosea]